MHRVAARNIGLHGAWVILGGVIQWMNVLTLIGGSTMKIWNKPQVREQAVGMEVTAYLPADIDLI